MRLVNGINNLQVMVFLVPAIKTSKWQLILQQRLFENWTFIHSILRSSKSVRISKTYQVVLKYVLSLAFV